MLFSDSDRALVSAAIGAAEATTSGEIVVIISTADRRYPATALSVGALFALALPLFAVIAGWNPADVVPDWDAVDEKTAMRHGFEVFAAVQAVVFVFALGLVYFTALGRRLTPHGLRRDRVHSAALTQFKARGLDGTTGRTGVLIYVDEPEHIAEVVADTAIYAKVKPQHWHTTVTALTDGIKAGSPAQGMVAAITLAGTVLAEHFPRAGDDVNELPDHLIEI